MKCASCGVEFDAKFKFCPECGTSVSSVSRMSGDSAMERELNEGATMIGPGVAGRETGEEDLSMGYGKTVMGEAVQGSGDGVQGSGFKVEGSELRTRYEILEEIGRGGFARVWRARDLKLGRLVAVKRLIEPAVKDHNWEMTLERFRREARAIAGLNHRNIVGVYDVGADGEGDYIVMELVEGGSLRDLLKDKGKLEPEEAVAMAKGIAQGLGHAHKKNLVHRDIKPANVLLLEEGGELIPKIVDFGLARVGSDSELSMSGYGMGTPWYMPPEQRRNAKGVNHTADIYALGKTLYELLTGEIPDNVDPESVSPGMARVILKCVKSNPEDRYFSVEEMVEELEKAGGGRFLHRTVGAHGGENVCPSCGTDNIQDAKFCENCGTGLVRSCPECGRENSIHKTFCVGCGTDVGKFLQMEEVAGRIRKFAEEKKWSRVEKEYGFLPDRDKLKGKKASKLLADVDATAKLAPEMRENREKINRQIEALLKEEKYTEALSQVEESLKLDPHQPELQRLKAEEIPTKQVALEKKNRERAWEELQAKLVELEAAEQWSDAVEQCGNFSCAWPNTEESARGESESARLACKGMNRLLEQVDKSLVDNQPAEALKALQKAEKLNPGHSGVKSRRSLLIQLSAKVNKDTKAAVKLSEINQVLAKWPGFIPAEEKKQILLEEQARRRKSRRRVMVRVVTLLLVIVSCLLWYSYHSFVANRHVAKAIEAKESGDWQTVRQHAAEALKIRSRHYVAQELEHEAREILKPVWLLEAFMDETPVFARIGVGSQYGNSPYRVELSEGQTYTARAFYKIGEREYSAQIVVDNVNWQGVREQRLQLEPAVGGIRVSLRVPDYAREFFNQTEVDVWVGSEAHRLSPGSLEWVQESVPLGTFEVGVNAKGFVDMRNQRVEVQDGQTGRLNFTLEPTPARINLTGLPRGVKVRLSSGAELTEISDSTEITVPSLRTSELHLSAPRNLEAVVQVPILQPGQRHSMPVRMEVIRVPLENRNWTSPAAGMEFVWIPTLRMWVGKYEVTNGEYRLMVRGHNSGEFLGHSLNGDRQPVVYVNFDDAKAYAEWMTLRDRAAGRLPEGYRYRLPTDQEWETFAKAGNNWEYPWGNNWPPVSGRAGNYHGQEGPMSRPKIEGYLDGHAVTAPVQQSWANPWGLFGVGGNVWEATARDAANSSFGAWRGGSWEHHDRGYLGASVRITNDGSYRNIGNGFRLVLSR